MSSTLSGLVNSGSAFVSGGVTQGRTGNAHPSITPYESYEASDRPMVITVGNDGQFVALVNELGMPELAADPRFATNPARVVNRPALNEALAPMFAAESADFWKDRLNAVGVPCGPVNDVAQAFEFAADVLPDSIAHFAQAPDQSTTANPVSLSATPVGYRTPPPPLGADDAEVRAWLSSPPPRR